jgi:amidase
MAGSLRTPASFCGVASLRPSPGQIRSDSEFLPFDILGAEGPMARSIEDLALFADVMMTGNNESMLSAARTSLQPTQIAVSEDLGIASISDEVIRPFRKFIDQLANAGSGITEQHPDLSGVHLCFDVLRAQSYAIGLEQDLADHPGVMKPEVVWNIESGLALTADQIREATRSQGQIINRAENFMQDFDLLICPATSLASVAAELRYPGSDGEVPYADYYRWLAIAYAITVTALPVITMPCGFVDNGMPVGIQLIGKPGGEFELFRYTSYLEQIAGWSAWPVDPISN